MVKGLLTGYDLQVQSCSTFVLLFKIFCCWLCRAVADYIKCELSGGCVSKVISNLFVVIATRIVLLVYT